MFSRKNILLDLLQIIYSIKEKRFTRNPKQKAVEEETSFYRFPFSSNSNY